MMPSGTFAPLHFISRAVVCRCEPKGEYMDSRDLFKMYVKETGRAPGESPEAYRDWLEEFIFELMERLHEPKGK